MIRRTLLVTLLLLVAACAAPPESGPPDRTVAFVGGNVGVSLGLINGAPPAAVYDGGRTDFGVGVVMTNLGEADIGPGTDNPFARVTLEGFLPSVFGVTQADLQRDLDRPLLGAKKNFDGSILPGQINNMMFQPLNFQGHLQGNNVYTILAKMCYDYENWATVPICFKNEIIENIEDAQICTLTGEKIPQNSGGPLQVTSLVQNPLDSYKVLITFVVEHVGTGDFFARVDDTCEASFTNPNMFDLDIEVRSGDGSMGIECSSLGGGSTGTLTLYQGAPATVSCTLTGADTGTRIYTDLIEINMRYRYSESIAQPIIVQALGNR